MTTVDPPWDSVNGPGNVERPFSDLIRLEKINNVTYRSIHPPFQPWGSAYGGHVFVQSVWAAAQTVKPGFVVHSSTGHFILRSQVTVPFVYKVHKVRDGGTYCTRIVNVTQSEDNSVCFTCTCSFKRPEDALLDVQENFNVEKEYAVVLEGKKPDDFPLAPGIDLPIFWRYLAQGGKDHVFPGLDMRKVDMDAYNASRHAIDRRQLLFYRVTGDLPDDDLNLHACAHMYASDRSSLFHVVNHYDVGETFTSQGSLSHTIIFHPHARNLAMMKKRPSNASPTSGAANGSDSADEERRIWFCKEDWSTRMGDGRGTYHSRVWAPDGTHIATVLQDGMMRKMRGTPPMRARKERL